MSSATIERTARWVTAADKHLAAVVAVGTLPRAPSGKLQRRFLRYR